MRVDEIAIFPVSIDPGAPRARCSRAIGATTPDALGSRVDRHEHIGKGKIGKEAFRYIVNDARFKQHPGCLETPKSEDLHEDVQNLATLRALAKAGVRIHPARTLRLE